MVVLAWDGYGRRSKRVGAAAICAVCLVFFAGFQLPRPSKSSTNHVSPTGFKGSVVKYGSGAIVSSNTPEEQDTAIVFLADYPEFPSGTPIGDLHYLKAVLIARLFNPTTPIFFLLPKDTVSRHPAMVTLLGSYRINIRWIDDINQTHSTFATFREKHKAFCERLEISNCHADLMYTRFGMAAQLLRAEGFRRALFMDNDVALYEDISFFTQYPEDFVSAFEWTTQVALWNVDSMDHFFSWLMHYFDNEPGPLRHDPGDTFAAQEFLRRHPFTSRQIFCRPEPNVAPRHCVSGPIFQAMESVQHVGCNLTLVRPSECPLRNCGDKFDETITWKQDEQGRYVPFLHGFEKLPAMHFSKACKNVINKKMYPVTLEGLEPATDRTYP